MVNFDFTDQEEAAISVSSIPNDKERAEMSKELQEIAALYDRGLLLQALGKVQEAEAVGNKDVSSCALVQLLKSLRKEIDVGEEQVADDKDWTVAREKNPTVLYRHARHSPYHSLKFKCDLPAPFEHGVAMGREFDLMATWNKYISSAEVLRDASPVSLRVQSTVSFVWPFSDRVSVVDSFAIDLLEERGYVGFLLHTPKDVDLDKVGEDRGGKPVSLYHCFVKVSPIPSQAEASSARHAVNAQKEQEQCAKVKKAKKTRGKEREREIVRNKERENKKAIQKTKGNLKEKEREVEKDKQSDREVGTARTSGESAEPEGEIREQGETSPTTVESAEPATNLPNARKETARPALERSGSTESDTSNCSTHSLSSWSSSQSSSSEGPSTPAAATEGSALSALNGSFEELRTCSRDCEGSVDSAAATAGPMLTPNAVAETQSMPSADQHHARSQPVPPPPAPPQSLESSSSDTSKRVSCASPVAASIARGSLGLSDNRWGLSGMRVEGVITVDPHTSAIPSAMLTFFFSVLSPYVYKLLCRLLQKFPEDKRMKTYHKRMKRKEELYRWVRERTADFLQIQPEPSIRDLRAIVKNK